MTARYDEMGPVRVPPTTGGPGVSLAATCDPAIPALLAAFKAIANTKLGAAWRAAAGKMAGNTPATATLIHDTFPHEPTRRDAERTWTGCALFMWRDKEQLGKRTQVYEQAGCTGALMFVLPPLCQEDTVKLEPIRTAVRTCLVLAVEHYGDPTYNGGADFLTAAGIDEFEFTAAEYGHLPAEVGLDQHHAALILTWRMVEREDFVLSQYTAMTAIDTQLTDKDDTGETEVVHMHYPVGPEPA